MKDFESWNKTKKNLDKRIVNFYPKEGEVWICSIGINIAYEQNGSGGDFIRPCLILKKINNNMFWIIPLPSKQKSLNFYFNFSDKFGNNVSLILAQIRLISVNRLHRKIYQIRSDILTEAKNKIREML